MTNEVDDARRVTIKCLCRIMKDNERNCCSWLLKMCSPHDGSFLLAMTKNACTHDGDLRTGRNSYGPALHTWLFRANRGRNQLVNASLCCVVKNTGYCWASVRHIMTPLSLQRQQNETTHRDPATIQCIHSLTLRSHVARAERMTISKYLLKKGTKQKPRRARSYFAQTAAAVVPRQSLLHPERRSCFWLLRLCLPHHDPFVFAAKANNFAHGNVETDAFTQGRFYTQKPLHKEAFAHKKLYTEKLLHRETFTQGLFAEQAFLTDNFTHRSLQTQKLLHRKAWDREVFPHRSL